MMKKSLEYFLKPGFLYDNLDIQVNIFNLFKGISSVMAIVIYMHQSDVIFKLTLTFTVTI